MRRLNYFFAAALTIGATTILSSCNDDNEEHTIRPIADDTPSQRIEATGFYVVNEDWLGHDNGTVNFFKKKDETTYEASYRIYRQANGEKEQLGITTQFGSIWGEYVYLISKQGNRLVVADAKTMKKRAVITEIGGDGRTFVGVSPTKAYISHSSGIAIFDIPSLTVTGQLNDIKGQTGMMCRTANRVFAVQNKMVYVINCENDTVEKSLNGDFYTLTCSRDGQVWIGGGKGLMRIDPTTLETEEIPYPAGGNIGNIWHAWNAGSLCASTQNNTLYWIGGGNKVFKFDVESRTASQIHQLGKSEFGENLNFYGAGMRVDPLTDELILTVKHSGWGASGAFNWIYKLDNEGKEITHFMLQGDNGSGESWSGGAADWNGKYFWFPAMPMFEDANKPQILLNQVMLNPGESTEIDLMKKIIDYDNSPASMQVSLSAEGEQPAQVTLEGFTLKVTAGATKGVSNILLSVESNGKSVEKQIQLVVK